MAEGKILETLIVVGALTVVLGAFSSILYRATLGDGQQRRLEKLKAELEKKNASEKK